MTTPIQEKRHEAKAAAEKVGYLLRGEPGMPKSEQVVRLSEALDAAAAMVEVLTEAKALAETRDFDAYMADKKAAAVLVPEYDDEDEDDDEF